MSLSAKSEGDIALDNVRPSGEVSKHSKESACKEWPKCGMLMPYPDHLQKWFDFSRHWPSFGLLVAKKLKKLGFPGILRRMNRRNGLRCSMLFLTAFKNDSILAIWVQFRHLLGQSVGTLPLLMPCLLYPPYPKDRGMLWFYVEAARHPLPAARNGVNAITQKPQDGLFSNLVYTLVVIVSWPD